MGPLARAPRSGWATAMGSETEIGPPRPLETDKRSPHERLSASPRRCSPETVAAEPPKERPSVARSVERMGTPTWCRIRLGQGTFRTPSGTTMLTWREDGKTVARRRTTCRRPNSAHPKDGARPTSGRAGGRRSRRPPGHRGRVASAPGRAARPTAVTGPPRPAPDRLMVAFQRPRKPGLRARLRGEISTEVRGGAPAHQEPEL